MIRHIDGSGNFNIPSDQYMNHPGKVKSMKEMGMDVKPVDLNEHFVPTEKFDSENLEEIEDSIHTDFNL